MREGGADVRHAEPSHEQLRELEHAGRQVVDGAREIGVAGLAGQLRVELADVADARRGRRDDDLVPAEHAHEPARQRERVAPVAAVHVHLPAAGLLGREHHLVPEALEHLHRRAPRLGKDRVADAGDEEGDAHWPRSLTAAGELRSLTGIRDVSDTRRLFAGKSWCRHPFG